MERITTDCESCGGAGTVDGDSCSACNGTGTEPMARTSKKPLYIS